MTLTLFAAWLSVNYAVAAMLAYRAARRSGAGAAAARRAALRWPLALAVALARDETPGLRRA